MLAGRYCSWGNMEKSLKSPFPSFPRHFHCQLMLNSENHGNTENVSNEMLSRKQIMIRERCKRLVGGLFFGGGIIFGGGKVEKYLLFLKAHL